MVHLDDRNRQGIERLARPQVLERYRGVESVLHLEHHPSYPLEIGVVGEAALHTCGQFGKR